MKKLIIVDTDDEKYTHAKVSLAYEDNDGMWADVNYETLPLRPMPLKRETQVAWVLGIKVPITTHEPSEYDRGWNDCVVFLEGEENE